MKAQQVQRGGPLWSVAAWVLCSTAAWAQDAPGTDAPQRVEVQGRASAPVAARREATGATVVVGRDELLRYGDQHLSDALRRVPGLSVSGTGSRAELRLSGLGGGYTQLLLNGEPVPPGFSLESIPPDQIERIEVSRAASAEQRQQAIAGSINIVLRRVASQMRRELKLGAGSHLGYGQASADLNLGDRVDDWAWSLGLGLSAERTRWPVTLHQTVTDANGQTVQAYRTDKREGGHDESLTLSPRLTWTLSENESLSIDQLLRLNREPGQAINHRTSEVGDPPTYTDDALSLRPKRVQWRGGLKWKWTLDDQSERELKLGYTWMRRDAAAEFNGYDAAATWIRAQQVNSVATDGGWDLAGRWRLPLAEVHAIAFGFDSDEKRRRENRVQRDQPLPGGIPVENLDESYDAQVQRLAVFVQDEWALSPQWQATLGLRWEGLHTRSQGNVFDTVDSRVSVVSPVIQWRLQPAGSANQWRLGVSRSYNPPTPRDLQPRRYVTADNTPTTPNWQGNPALRPELAWGLDLGWERALGKSSQVGVNAYVKRVDDVIAGELLYTNQAWVFRRANQGRARLWGVTADLQLVAREQWPQAPDMDLRASVGWNQSHLDSVPGPDNRLAEQTPLSLTLGLDHRVAGTDVQWGANLAWTSTVPARVDVNRWSHKSAGRVLDLYLAWQASADALWRLTVGNALDTDEVVQRQVIDAGTLYDGVERLRTGLVVRLGLELKL